MSIPDRSTTAGAAYLDLQRIAREAGRPVQELFEFYGLEGFVRRLSMTSHASSFVLKGGVLIAAYSDRRATRDVDLAGIGVPGDIDSLTTFVNDVISVDLDDGITGFELGEVVEIRDDAQHPGVRATVDARLSRAKLHFHIDINIGDPIWPAALMVDLPQLLSDDHLPIRGYPPELILAEKIVTAVARGTASTRWRDFVDIAALARADHDRGVLVEAIARVAAHRVVELDLLTVVLDRYGAIGQDRWMAWRRKQKLEDRTPESFDGLLAVVIPFADDVLAEAMSFDLRVATEVDAHLPHPSGPLSN